MTPQSPDPARWIADVLEHVDDESAIARIRGAVSELCSGFPLYAGRG